MTGESAPGEPASGPPDGASGVPDVLPRRRDEVLVADFDTEMVVLVPEDRLAHRLDSGLSLILASCDGVTRSVDLIAEVVAGTDDDPDAVSVWLANGVAELRRLKILA